MIKSAATDHDLVQSREAIVAAGFFTNSWTWSKLWVLVLLNIAWCEEGSLQGSKRRPPTQRPSRSTPIHDANLCCLLRCVFHDVFAVLSAVAILSHCHS